MLYSFSIDKVAFASVHTPRANRAVTFVSGGVSFVAMVVQHSEPPLLSLGCPILFVENGVFDFHWCHLTLCGYCMQDMIASKMQWCNQFSSVCCGKCPASLQTSIYICYSPHSTIIDAKVQPISSEWDTASQSASHQSLFLPLSLCSSW